MHESQHSDNRYYKKMAGTAAVFVFADLNKASPVERDGLVWDREELQLDQLSKNGQIKESMASVLALEGLEEYDPPEDGDCRYVEAIGAEFIYFKQKQAWIQRPQESKQ